MNTLNDQVTAAQRALASVDLPGVQRCTLTWRPWLRKSRHADPLQGLNQALASNTPIVLHGLLGRLICRLLRHRPVQIELTLPPGKPGQRTTILRVLPAEPDRETNTGDSP